MEVEIAKRVTELRKTVSSERGRSEHMFVFGVAALVSGTGFAGLVGGFGIGAVAVAIIGGVIAFVLEHDLQIKPYRKSVAASLLAEQSLQHRPALRRNLAKAFKRNDYGTVTSDKRLMVAEEFANSVALPKGILSLAEILAVIETALGDAAATDAARGGDLDMVPADPILFEQWVADKLRFKGWDAVVTPASGDQGIDVIARKGAMSVGIQCKLYTGAVSNTAVQEVIAGVMYHGLMKGAVLTNAKYTQSAINLAKTANVVLMSHYDLSDPDKKFM